MMRVCFMDLCLVCRAPDVVRRNALRHWRGAGGLVWWPAFCRELSIWTPLVIVAGGRIRKTSRPGIPTVHLYVTDVAIHKTGDILGIVVRRAIAVSDTMRGWVMPRVRNDNGHFCHQ